MLVLLVVAYVSMIPLWLSCIGRDLENKGSDKGSPVLWTLPFIMVILTGIHSAAFHRMVSRRALRVGWVVSIVLYLFGRSFGWLLSPIGSFEAIGTLFSSSKSGSSALMTLKAAEAITADLVLFWMPIAALLCAIMLVRDLAPDIGPADD